MGKFEIFFLLNVMSLSGFVGRIKSRPISSGYTDPIAHLSGFPANQAAEGVVYRRQDYSPPSSHEIELLLRFKITPNFARGYEICLGYNGAYASIVRWNGPLGDFTILNSTGPGTGALVNGDIVRATAVGNVITVYKNGIEVMRVVDNGWSDGNPGIGFFVRPGSGSILYDYSWTSYKAWGL